MDWDLEETMEFYRRQGAPGDQNAVLALLREVQCVCGGSIPRHIPGVIAAHYGTKEALYLALIRRIPSLRLGDSHVLELCAGPNCSKRAALGDFVEKTYGTAPKEFTLKYVPCMRMCGKGPNLRWDGKLYHRADEKLIRKLVEEAK